VTFTASLLSRRELLLQLTDARDPFFLYTLRLSEDDFAALRRSQDIRVTFAAFPASVELLASSCARDAAGPNPRYTAELHIALGEASLLFIEANAFRNLTHLALRMAPGDDAAVKTHLARCLREARAEAAASSAAAASASAEHAALLSQLETVRHTFLL
jgi:spindle assembly abnormal protein 6